MADSCELRGELKYRDGLKKTVRIETEKNFPSILSGIKKLNADVSELLSELVAQEKLSGSTNFVEADDDAGDGEDEDDSEEEMEETKISVSEPPLKRSKSLRT